MEELCLSPHPIAPTTRIHAADIRLGDRVIVDGATREVVARARAIDGVLEFRTADGGVVCLHPFRRVSVVG